ncbi:MAG: hypothetical protein IT161_22975, partial [Bryobacterales bacterium]|nr:hypothetical protein [Bryobacterales bacterium]
MILRVACLGMVCVSLLAQKYQGPAPPKPDIPYLLHASNLVETEVGEAQESKMKDDLLYTVRGATSTARTPLAEPIFIVDAQKLFP